MPRSPWNLVASLTRKLAARSGLCLDDLAGELPPFVPGNHSPHLMRTFGHTVREGAVIGFAYAYSCAFVLFLALILRQNSGLPPSGDFPVLECIAVTLPPWGFLAVFGGYAHAAKYQVTVDEKFIILYKDGEEIERRTTRKVMRLYAAYRQPRSRMEFMDEPALIIPWMSRAKLGQIRGHVFRLGEAASREQGSSRTASLVAFG